MSTQVMHYGPMVDHGSATPIYIQVAAILRGRIESGEYPPGHRLPSADYLAQEHGIAPNTAIKALHLLRAEGLAEMTQGRGTFVKRA